MSVQHSFEQTRSPTHRSFGKSNRLPFAIGGEDQPSDETSSAGPVVLSPARRGAIQRAQLQVQAIKAAAKVSMSDGLRAAVEAFIDFLPEYDRLAKAHDSADEALGPNLDDPRLRAAEQQADRAFSRGLERMRRLGLAVLREPARTNDEALLKLAIYAAATGSDAIDPLGLLFDTDFKPALASAIRDLKALGGAVRGQADWERAVRHREKAQAAYDANTAASRRCSIELAEAAPPECRTVDAKGRQRERWYSIGCFEEDRTLSREKKDLMRPIVQSWLACREKHPAYLEDARLDEEANALLDVVAEADRRLLETPAPTIDAALYKSSLVASLMDDTGRGHENLARVAFLARAGMDDALSVHLHRDLLRLAGRHHPMLDVEFDPRVWMRQFAAAGGVVACPGGEGLYLSMPVGNDTGAERQRALLDELRVEGDWKARAVFMAAEKRMRCGGDPIYDRRGEVRSPSSRS